MIVPRMRPVASMIGLAFLAFAAPAAAGDIHAIKHRVESGQARCAAIIAGYLDRIEARDVLLNSIVAIDPTAMHQAQAIDRLPVRRKRALPMLCTPVLIKDNIDVAGLPTTAGSIALKGNIAPRDAAVVAALRKAGAIPIAKTNMSEFAFNYRGRSSVRGQTLSPYAILESAGGSSSGSGAALAARLAVLAIGTDTSGSLRVPAALTGTIGLRPGFGLMSRDGVIPLSPSQDVVGPMCRDIDDCIVAMTILAPKREARSPTDPLRGLRVGVLNGLFPEGAMKLAVDAALARLSDARVANTTLRDQKVLVGAVPAPEHSAPFASRSAFDFPTAMDAYLPGKAGLPVDARALLDTLERDGTDPAVARDVAKFIANRDSAPDDPRRLANGAFRVAFVEERIAQAFSCAPDGSCFDVLLYPSVQDVAADAARGPETAGTHRLAAYSGRPAIAFPIGSIRTAAGIRPVSVELMGRPGSEAMLMAIVKAWQARLALPRARPCDREAAAVCLVQAVGPARSASLSAAVNSRTKRAR